MKVLAKISCYVSIIQQKSDTICSRFNSWKSVPSPAYFHMIMLVDDKRSTLCFIIKVIKLNTKRGNRDISAVYDFIALPDKTLSQDLDMTQKRVNTVFEHFNPFIYFTK